MIRRTKQTQGFTLVELSIVLVIIGLIIGGVLTGQQIIENAKITNAVNGLQAYQAQFQTYAQNYGALPGDDIGASGRFSSLKNVKTSTDGNDNKKVGDSSSFDTSDTSGEAFESRLVWAHLRAAGLVKNQVTNGTTAIQPSNPFGGYYGFQNGAFNSAFTTTVVCMEKVPSGAAQAIDSKLDDGVPNKGSLQATTYTGDKGSSANAAVDSYSDTNTYTLCMKL